MDAKGITDDHPANDCWGYKAIPSRLDRVALVERYNKLVGPPSYAMRVVQEELIHEKMEPGEMIAFVKVLQGLIASAHRLGVL